MVFKRVLFICICCVSFACNPSPQKPTAPAEAKPVESAETNPAEVTEQTDQSIQDHSLEKQAIRYETGQVFFAGKDFRIDHVTYDTEAHSSDSDTTKCSRWRPSAADIKTMLQHAQLIDPFVWHHLYDVLRCQTHCTVSVDGQQIPININAGSWITMDLQDTTLMLGDTLTAHEQFFLSNAWRAEDQ